MGIQMNQKELTKTFMMLSHWIKLFGLHVLYKNYPALTGSFVFCTYNKIIQLLQKIK